MKNLKHVRNALLILIAAVCCVCFAACELFSGNQDLTGKYELVSFTTAAGDTFRVGDIYNDVELVSGDITLSLQEFESGFVDNDGKPVMARKFTLTSNIGESIGSLGFFTRNGSSLTFPSLMGDSEFTGKVLGSKITLTFSSDSNIKSVVVQKV